MRMQMPVARAGPMLRPAQQARPLPCRERPTAAPHLPPSCPPAPARPAGEGDCCGRGAQAHAPLPLQPAPQPALPRRSRSRSRRRRPAARRRRAARPARLDPLLARPPAGAGRHPPGRRRRRRHPRGGAARRGGPTRPHPAPPLLALPAPPARRPAAAAPRRARRRQRRRGRQRRRRRRRDGGPGLGAGAARPGAPRLFPGPTRGVVAGGGGGDGGAGARARAAPRPARAGGGALAALGPRGRPLLAALRRLPPLVVRQGEGPLERGPPARHRPGRAAAGGARRPRGGARARAL
jgi:hypothetical protein